MSKFFEDTMQGLSLIHIQISDRIMVMCHGEAIGVVDAKSTTKEELGLMMAGKKKGDA